MERLDNATADRKQLVDTSALVTEFRPIEVRDCARCCAVAG